MVQGYTLGEARVNRKAIVVIQPNDDGLARVNFEFKKIVANNLICDLKQEYNQHSTFMNLGYKCKMADLR